MKENEIEGFTCFEFDADVSRSPVSGSLDRLVLESSASPDYYAKNNFPPNQKHLTDRHLYLLVKNQVICFQDLVLRLTANLRQKQSLAIKVFPGQISFNKHTYQCIRVNVNNRKDLPLLISEFESAGIKFLNDKKVPADNAHVVYKKYIEYDKVEEGVFRDANNRNRYFFSAPHRIDFDQFKAVMDQIKLSCDFNLFDSFLSYLFVKEEVTDFIGIYSKHCDQSRFNDLKEEIHNRF
ncbi:MAG: hypothetical protein ABFS10_01855 [Bacteroidota bacterium]